LRTLYPEKEVAPVQGLLLAHNLVLAPAQAAAKGAMQTIMSPMMTARQAAPSSTSMRTLMKTTSDNFAIQIKAILFLPTLPLQKQGTTSVLPNRELRQQSDIFLFHLVSLFQIRNLIFN
jgi:hypothetical protein